MELPDGNGGGRNCQYVVVMRHGDRLDNVDPAWPASAERPWDPPLHPDGMDRAFAVGGRIREDLGSPIHRLFVSPFLRCLQTASEAVRGLCTVANSAGDSGSVSLEAAAVDLSKIKVSVEMGLCEMLNTRAIRPNVAPKDGDFKFNLSQCESQLPTGTIDQNAEKIYKKLPDWEEPVLAARTRYVDVAKALADKYPSENLLLVTHGEGVGSVFSAAMKGASVYEVDYCGFTILRRDIDFGQGKPLIAGELTNHSDSGIMFLARSASHA